jgi:hypothetical protein
VYVADYSLLLYLLLTDADVSSTASTAATVDVSALHYAMLWCVVMCCAIMRYVALHCTMLCCVALCCDVLYGCDVDFKTLTVWMQSYLGAMNTMRRLVVGGWVGGMLVRHKINAPRGFRIKKSKIQRYAQIT